MSEIKLTKEEKELAQTRKILAIKSIFQRRSGGLKEARDVVENYLNSISSKKEDK